MVISLADLVAAASQQNELPATQSIPAPEENVTPDIQVTNQPPIQQQAVNPMYSLVPNSDDATQIQQAAPDSSPYPQTQASPQQVARTKNLEGLPGSKPSTLRAILGTIGDALLINSGHQAIYAPAMERQKLSDAMVGYGQGNPDADKAAIARVMAVNPDEGRKLFDQYQQGVQQQTDNDLRRAQIDAVGQQKLAANQLAKFKLVPNLLAAAKGDPKQQQAIAAWYKDPSLSIDDLDPNLLAGSAINAYQQAQLGQGQQRLGETQRHNQATESIGQQNAAANTTRANRAPTGRAENADERYIRLSNQDPSTLSKGEAAWLNSKNTKGRQNPASAIIAQLKGTGGSSGGSSKAPPVGYKNKYGLTFQGGDPNNRQNWK